MLSVTFVDQTPGVATGRPTAILLTGVPGSGKTTLARELSRTLRVPHLARDDVRTGLYFTVGAWTAQPGPVPTVEDSVDAFLTVAASMLAAGVSAVFEYVFRADHPEHLDRLLAHADGVVVRTRSLDAIDRFAARNRADPLVNRPEVLAALGYDSNEAHTAAAIPRMLAVEHAMQATFDLPTLDVDTTDGYDPPLERIIEFVTTRR